MTRPHGPGPATFQQYSEPQGFDPLGAPGAAVIPGPISRPMLSIDPINRLPGEASRSRLESCRQQWHDARALYLPLSDAIHETRTALQRAQSRHKFLITPKVAGGGGLREATDDEPADVQVADIRATIAPLEAEMRRLETLARDRSAVVESTGRLMTNVENFLRSGVPNGVQLVEIAPLEPSKS